MTKRQGAITLYGSGWFQPGAEYLPRFRDGRRKRMKCSVSQTIRTLLPILVLAISLATARGGSADVELFEKKIRPVLVEHCYKCHSAQAKKPKGGLFVDSRAALLKGGDSGPAIVPGRPEKSRFIEAIGYKDVELRMPPRAKLPETAITDLTAWVKNGAPWPGVDNAAKAGTARAEFDLPQRKAKHWAWRLVRPQPPPAVVHAGWPRQPVDRFILAKLEANDLKPAPPADRRTLLRRLYFDLIGLPPAPEEVEAFVNDASPGAVAQVVDRLLASNHFGERWGRHWLDLVRYAETRGHEFDFPLPNAYQYRDYVIRALNADVPYNRFVQEHVAGDLLASPRLHPTEGFNESILGTGFWFLGEELHSPVDLCQDEADRIDNKIDVLTKTFLGLTVSCARCHDHKFDAISTKDYYALVGFLESGGYRQVRFDSQEHNRRVAAELWRSRVRSRPPVLRALADSLRPGVERMGDYLLAAREAILAGYGREPVRLSQLEEIARNHQLRAAVLNQWVAYLPRASKDSTDPLHAWARLVQDPTAEEPKRLAELLKPLLDGGRKREADARAALAGAEIVVDYRALSPLDWLPDGVAFGPGPVRPGEVRFRADPARPVASFAERGAAEKDSTWDRLRVPPGTETDPGALGGVVRAGRSLRTPSFLLTTGKVFYLVKGSARVYAAVNSHALIAGPLHGRLVTTIKTGEHFQWVGHDLSVYKGQRVHIEFTPAEGSAFAVALVVQAEKTPGAIDRPNKALGNVLAAAASLEALAGAYGRLFLDVTNRLAADGMTGTPNAGDYAGLANWLIGHPELLAANNPTTRRCLTRAVEPYLAERAKLLAQIKDESRLALAICDGNGVDERVFIRGSPKNLGTPAPRRFLEALAGPKPLASARGGGRLELAQQMTDPAINPFIARVLVNRVWHHLFGRGLVASVDNFGVLGEAPTHPELLDYLADRFVQEGWSLKKLIRSLVLSGTYQMSSRPDEKADQADPQNLLLHRMRVRRLEGEAIRDAMLAASGRLDTRMYGPSVAVHLTAFQEGRGRPPGGPLDGDGRRSLYLAVRRNFLSSMLLAFDTPTPFSTVGRRTVSNVPAQALILMNDPFAHQQANVWARRILGQSSSPAERVNRMYLSAFGRPPTEAEASSCLDFLTQQARLSAKTPEDFAVWTDLAHVLFNVKEFIFLN